jgi:hypothetical protein
MQRLYPLPFHPQSLRLVGRPLCLLTHALRPKLTWGIGMKGAPRRTLMTNNMESRHGKGFGMVGLDCPFPGMGLPKPGMMKGSARMRMGNAVGSGAGGSGSGGDVDGGEGEEESDEDM